VPLRNTEISINKELAKHLVNLLVACAFALATYSLWAMLNLPQTEPFWPKRIQGFAFSPYLDGQDPISGDRPDLASLRADLALLSGKTNAIRTYTVEGVFANIPRLADEFDINVTLGVWIEGDPEKDQEQVDRGIRIAWRNKNVVRLIVGNEVLLRGDITEARLIEHLDHVREQVHQPVSTAEPWHIWIANPTLAAHVDYIAVHLLPYWEGMEVESAVEDTFGKYDLLRETFPGKRVVIAEVGWPSRGRTRQSAVASELNEARFLRRFLAEAERRGYVYYLMEAFDQPWKAQNEGAVGAYWGVWNVDRQPKFELEQPVVGVPSWPLLAAASILLALALLAVLYIDSDVLRSRGRSFLGFVAYALATIIVWVAYDYSQQYLTWEAVAVGVLLFIGMLGVVLVLLTEAHEWAEAHWVSSRRRVFVPVDRPHERLPFVSVHVPAYNEPPDMLIETLDALARLDYPHLEILVIDNNTPLEATWRPVEAHCQKLGPRFRFFHVKPLAGFKAGALNFALQHTDERAEVVAVIDSDYTVTADWLKSLVPFFDDPAIGIVQAPQDYRDQGESLFKAMCYAEYRGFFYIGMITRNERNAIVQHGTMTMIRRHVLQESGAWAEWCITEDAELGLRVFEEGHGCAYIPHSYGKGLMPDTFTDYKIQRSRWAYGSVQILRTHLSQLFGFKRNRLTAGQRYHFIAGWLPWFADGFNLFFNVLALAWSIAMILMPATFDPPLIAFAVLPVLLFVFKLAKILHLYLTRVGANVRQSLGAILAGLALAHTIGRAVAAGLFTRRRPFIRTPKRADRHALFRAMTDAREESLFMLALWLAAFGISQSGATQSPDLLVWVLVLLLQSLPYATALVFAFISGLRLPARWLGPTTEMERLSHQLVSRDLAD
jgi:exo-beta-1,3-glucanase (GH17 family)/cellulose synthase/poly-beta-1,6-N-acetylglucosamine synthase-like glycosyltransferase